MPLRDAASLPPRQRPEGRAVRGFVLMTTRTWQNAVPATIQTDANEDEDVYETPTLSARVHSLHADRIAATGTRELRRGDTVWTVQRIADLGAPLPGSVVAVWFPDEPRALAILGLMSQRKRWPIIQAADGVFTVPALTADTTAPALAVKAAWPASWRRYKAGDIAPDPLNGIVGTGPTGALIVGSGIV